MTEKHKHTGIKIIFIFIIFIIIILLYGFYLNPNQFKVKEIAITNNLLPASYNGLKIVQFSDIHLKTNINDKYLQKIVNEINKLNADIIIFTGDLFDSKPTEDNIKSVTKYLNEITCKLKKIAIIGDHDTKYLDEYKEILNNCNFILLDNTNTLIYYKNNIPLNIVGFTNNIENDLYSSEYFNITLIHKPDLIKNITNPSLVFAGHSLGGQIKLPFKGGIIKKDGASTYLNEHYKLDKIDLYISNGLGTENINFRLFNTPSITLYRLYK